ncbi:MAG TPA: hypothetical protein ENO07_01725 [candidate division Zixibacteria bacterium]|nr:hypothetical protein [candidate division Zixibacteria bacterium]
MAKAVKTKSAAVVNILIVVLILVVVNLLSINIFARWDLTEENIYSISEPSKKIISSLDDRLTVKVFFTEDLPAPHNTDRRYLKDLLDDFRAYSNGNMVYEFVEDPLTENRQEASSYNLQPVQFNVMGSTTAEQKLGYKALVLIYGGENEKIPFINNMEMFEYDFIRLVKNLSERGKTRVGFTFGHGELPLDGQLTIAKQILQEDFEVVPIDLRKVPEIPGDVEALFIVAPSERFSDRALYVLDQYIMRGGKVGFFLNRFKMNQNMGTIDRVDTGLDSLLRAYGVGVKQNFAIDQNCYTYMDLRRVEGGFMPVNVKVPFFININNFNEENLVTKYQKTMSLIGASTLDTSVQIPEGVEREILFTTSEKSGTISENIQARLQQIDDLDYDQFYLPLAAVLSGQFESYFADKFVPAADSADTAFVPPAQEKLNRAIENSRLLVVGSGNFFDDQAARDRSRRFQQNFVFFRNIADWLAQDDELITIRSKGNIYSPFTRVIDRDIETTVKLINIFAMPVVIIIFGLIRWQVKRSAKRSRAV